jgi:thiamine pyrophosphokinase
MRVFVVAGSPQAAAPQDLAPTPTDRVIAADRGAQHARRWGWPVHLLVGDLDSLPAGEVAALAAAGVPMLTAPTAKDETDLELALREAIRLQPTEIIICAALGGRTDHWLANLLLLAQPALAGTPTVIAGGPETIRLLRGETDGARAATGTRATLALDGRPGDLLSLLSIGGDAVGIVTEGLAYPLRDETLSPGQPRGVSNVFTGTRASVSLRRGLLLVIVTRITDQSESLNER